MFVFHLTYTNFCLRFSYDLYLVYLAYLSIFILKPVFRLAYIKLDSFSPFAPKAYCRQLMLRSVEAIHGDFVLGTF